MSDTTRTLIEVASKLIRDRLPGAPDAFGDYSRWVIQVANGHYDTELPIYAKIDDEREWTAEYAHLVHGIMCMHVFQACVVLAGAIRRAARPVEEHDESAEVIGSAAAMETAIQPLDVAIVDFVSAVDRARMNAIGRMARDARAKVST